MNRFFPIADAVLLIERHGDRSECFGRCSLAVNNTVRRFDGPEFRAFRDLGHVDDSTLKVMQKHGFAAKAKNGDPITPEQRDAFNKTRVDYWKQRATDE